VETVNTAVSIFSKTTGATIATDSLDDFLLTTGGLGISGYSFADAFSTYDSLAQRFVVGDIYSNFADGNAILLAVSKSATPTTLTAADWNFFSLNTSEPGVGFQDYPGNLGYNADALVITLNSFGSFADAEAADAPSAAGIPSTHVLVNWLINPWAGGETGAGSGNVLLPTRSRKASLPVTPAAAASWFTVIGPPAF
jgi:hypothetical protein